MHTFILSDYITIRGISGATFTQNETGWLDLTPYEDLIFTLDIRQITGGAVTFNFQTAPAKDDVLFTNMLTGTNVAVASAPTVLYPKALMSTATVPVARFVRYTINGPAAAWDCTFRIYVAANSPGM